MKTILFSDHQIGCSEENVYCALNLFGIMASVQNVSRFAEPRVLVA